MMRSSPLYWLLDVEAYDFDIGVLKDTDLTGKALILSSQLWSLIREDKVVSVLIGPGIFKGVAQNGNRRVDVLEFIGALMFDPTVLRMEEPVPLVDIINPEVIDPLAAKGSEDIVTMVREFYVEKGNVLSGELEIKIQQRGSLPTVAHGIDLLKKISVNHVSGIQRARFILGGTNGPLYKPFVQHYNNHGFLSVEKMSVCTVPFSKFTNFSDIQVMSDWMIVEKAGMESQSGIEAMRSEYDQTLEDVTKNEESFIYPL